MFYTSKLLAAFLQPLTWAVVLFMLALWWLPKRPLAGRRALIAGIGVSAVIGWLPLPDALLRHMENQYSAPQGSLQPYVGMVVLGGAIGIPCGEQDGRRYTLNASAQRMTAPVALLREYPHLLLLFSGGQSDVIARAVSVADAAREFYASMGVSADRVLYERAARNTYENAVLSARVPGVDKTQPWLLVTSAWHMPRSMALFQREGWNVTPYAVDYRTGSYTPWSHYSIAEGALRWETLLHEVVGLAVATHGFSR
ncbi:MAG: YdcF family protein [Candidatus Methylumidiphilus sp.]